MFLMTAQGRLAKAERQLQRLRVLHPRIAQDSQARQEFIDVSEDCLVTLRSVPDHRLEEANQGYGLGIGLDEPLYENVFRIKAQNNAPALNYLGWHSHEKKRIETTATYGIPLDRRDLGVHRIETRLEANVEASERITISDALKAEVTWGSTGKTEVVYSSAPPPKAEMIASSPPRVFWSFPEIPGRDALEVLEDLLARMKQFVADSDKKL